MYEGYEQDLTPGPSRRNTEIVIEATMRTVLSILDNDNDRTVTKAAKITSLMMKFFHAGKVRGRAEVTDAIQRPTDS
jgi:hypothetical protein